jgi:hypothetical protein
LTLLLSTNSTISSSASSLILVVDEALDLKDCGSLQTGAQGAALCNGFVAALWDLALTLRLTKIMSI